MARLGSKQRPAVVRVRTQDRADELLDLCSRHDWHLIAGVEPNADEDITDVLKLLHPENFTRRVGHQPRRNEPCPCGSGAKYKKCCLRAPSTPPQR